MPQTSSPPWRALTQQTASRHYTTQRSHDSIFYLSQETMLCNFKRLCYSLLRLVLTENLSTWASKTSAQRVKALAVQFWQSEINPKHPQKDGRRDPTPQLFWTSIDSDTSHACTHLHTCNNNNNFENVWHPQWLSWVLLEQMDCTPMHFLQLLFLCLP